MPRETFSELSAAKGGAAVAEAFVSNGEASEVVALPAETSPSAIVALPAGTAATAASVAFGAGIVTAAAAADAFAVPFAELVADEFVGLGEMFGPVPGNGVVAGSVVTGAPVGVEFPAPVVLPPGMLTATDAVALLTA